MVFDDGGAVVAVDVITLVSVSGVNRTKGKW